MQIIFQREGGLAYFPKLSEPVSLDTDTVGKEKADQLELLVEKSRFFELPNKIVTVQTGAADYFTYTITVTRSGRTHTVMIVEPIANAEVQKLVDYLSTLLR